MQWPPPPCAGQRSQREALATLTRVPGLQDQPEDRRFGRCQLAPRPLPHDGRPVLGVPSSQIVSAEHLVGAIARLDPDFIVQLLAGATDAQKYRAFRVLDRAADHQPHLVERCGHP